MFGEQKVTKKWQNRFRGQGWKWQQSMALCLSLENNPATPARTTASTVQSGFVYSAPVIAVRQMLVVLYHWCLIRLLILAHVCAMLLPLAYTIEHSLMGNNSWLVYPSYAECYGYMHTSHITPVPHSFPFWAPFLRAFHFFTSKEV